jgi:hypothetical protein
VVIASYSMRSWTISHIKKWKDDLWSFVKSRETVKGLFKWQTLREPKVAQLYKVLHKWFTAMHSEGEPVSGAVMIEKLILLMMKWKN